MGTRLVIWAVSSEGNILATRISFVLKIALYERKKLTCTNSIIAAVHTVKVIEELG